MLVFPKQPVGRVAEEGRGYVRPFTPVGTCHREGIGCVLSHKQGVVAVVRRGLATPSSTVGLSGGDFLKRKEKSYLKEEYS